MTPPPRKLVETVASFAWKVYESRDNETVFFAGVAVGKGFLPGAPRLRCACRGNRDAYGRFTSC